MAASPHHVFPDDFLNTGEDFGSYTSAFIHIPTAFISPPALTNATEPRSLLCLLCTFVVHRLHAVCPVEMQQDAACFRYSFTFFSGVAAGHVKLAPGHIDWAPAVIPDDIPKDLPFSDTPVVAYVSLNDHVSKFSFALFDFLYPVFNMLKLLGVYDPNFQLLLAEQHQVSLKARQARFTPQFATLFTSVCKAFYRSGKLRTRNYELKHASHRLQENNC